MVVSQCQDYERLCCARANYGASASARVSLKCSPGDNRTMFIITTRLFVCPLAISWPDKSVQ